MLKDELIKLMLIKIKEICEEGEIEVGNLTKDTPLFGGGSIIDSLALVGLIVSIEEYIYEKIGLEIQIIDEDAIITDTSTPFRNADSLAALVLEKINAG